MVNEGSPGFGRVADCRVLTAVLVERGDGRKLGLEHVRITELVEGSFEYLGAGRGGLGAGLQQAFHQVITRRATGVFAGGGGAHDLVDLVPVHVRLLGKRLAHGHERGGDRGTRGGVLAQQAELADCFLALDVAGKRLRVSLNQARRHKRGDPARVQPRPGLPVELPSQQRLPVTLGRGQVGRRPAWSHPQAAHHRPRHRPPNRRGRGLWVQAGGRRAFRPRACP